jgi:hypothetical protein
MTLDDRWGIEGALPTSERRQIGANGRAKPAYIPAAATFGDREVDPETEAAWRAANAAKITALPILGPPIEVLSQPDVRDDPDAVVTPPGWRPGDPLIKLERRGPSYVVHADPTGLILTFREVRTDRELAADVSVTLNGDHHLVRTTMTLSLAGRDKLAKTVSEFGRINDEMGVRRAVSAAVEAVLAAEEELGAAIDLRSASLTLPGGGLYILKPPWPVGTLGLNGPGDGGKSTVARAFCISLAGGIEVIPGIAPAGAPRPVLYVAGEDPTAFWHTRSIEAICRALGVDRARLAQPIELFDARGRPLHRIARDIAERAADFGAVILDSQQALLAQADAAGGVRDRDSLFWHSVDQLDCSALVVAHPNRADSRDWQRADDGRAAGSEVNRDRVRMAWRLRWRDEKAVAGTSFRRYTLLNTKNNHGPKEDPIAFAAVWTFGYGDDPGELHFLPSQPLEQAPAAEGLSRAMSEALAAYQDGATTAEALMKAIPSIPSDQAARQRLTRLRQHLAKVKQQEEDEA